MDSEGLESLVNLIKRIEVTNENKMQVKEINKTKKICRDYTNIKSAKK